MRTLAKVGMVLALVAGSSVIVTCGGGGSSPSGDQATIDLASVERAIDEVSTAIPICQQGGAAASRLGAAPAPPVTPWLTGLLELRRSGVLRPTLSLQGLGPTKPADEFGDCGGRMTYTDYSHSGGVTQGVLAFESYCEVNDNTGERNISSGQIAFVNTGTPSASGPITQRIEADSPNGITVVTRTAAGAEVGNQNFRFTDYLYVAGVPGGDPTASSPDRLTLADGRLTDNKTGKVYRQTSLSVTYFQTTAGGEQLSVSGRGYRSNGDWYQVSTPTPVTSDANGDILGGALAFGGAGNTTATMTLVPGPRLQGTMRVNGTPVTNVPACQ